MIYGAVYWRQSIIKVSLDFEHIFVGLTITYVDEVFDCTALYRNY